MVHQQILVVNTKQSTTEKESHSANSENIPISQMTLDNTPVNTPIKIIINRKETMKPSIVTTSNGEGEFDSEDILKDTLSVPEKGRSQNKLSEAGLKERLHTKYEVDDPIIEERGPGSPYHSKSPNFTNSGKS